MRGIFCTLCNFIFIAIILESINFIGKVSCKSVFQMELEIDACEQMASWEQIYQAETIHGSTEILAQNENSGPQVFYAVRCRSEFSPCHGIKPGIVSRCETRLNPTTAIVVDKLAPNEIRWEVVLIPGQCVCTESFNNLTSSFL